MKSWMLIRTFTKLRQGKQPSCDQATAVSQSGNILLLHLPRSPHSSTNTTIIATQFFELHIPQARRNQDHSLLRSFYPSIGIACRMSGLQGFMQQTANARGSTVARTDRAAAQKLKIDFNTRYSSARKSRNTSREPEYYPQAQVQSHHRSSLPALAPKHREHLDSSSVADDFDKTLSERGFSGHPDNAEQTQESDVDSEDLEDPASDAQNFEDDGGYAGHHEEDERRKYDTVILRTHALHRSAGSPNIKRQNESNHAAQGGQAINGRFQPQPMAIRNQSDQHSPSPKPKKRPHSTEPDHQNYFVEQAYHTQQPDYRPKKEHRSQQQITAPPLTPGARRDTDNDKHVSPDRTPRQPASSLSLHLLSEPDVPEDAKAHEPRIPLDHSIEEMRNMTFAQLSEESWEVGVDESPDDRPLPDRLQEIMNDVVLGEPNHAHMEFFSKMPTTEWEESGEWFAEQFSGIMQAMIEKRKQRRVLTTKYEAELMQREKAVRGKSDALERKFADMRAGGKNLLKGKV